jgi:glycosyltransferase involved in cell wall biosynthesis
LKNNNILIINEYAGSLQHGMTLRHYYLAREFKKLNIKTTIVTASYSHFLKSYPKMKNKMFKQEKVDGIDYLWIKVIKYARSFDKKRVIKWFEFMVKLFFIGKCLKNKPAILICSPTAPFCILPAYFLAKKYRAKLVFEVRDIWPLTLVELGGFSQHNLFIKLMGWFERFALKKADIVVSNLADYKEHIKNITIDKKTHWISNGINLDEIKNIEDISENIRKRIPKDRFIVGYTGKLGVSNAIDYLIDVAKLLAKNKNIFFVVVGDGQEKDKLINKAKKLTNIIFIETIKKTQVQTMLSLFDVCFIGLHKENLFKYGVSPNKLFDYMLSAKPIIFSIDTNNDIVSFYNCGLSVEAENVAQIKKAIEKLYHMSEGERKRLGENGKRAVLENFTYQKLAKKYISILEDK